EFSSLPPRLRPMTAFLLLNVSLYIIRTEGGRLSTRRPADKTPCQRHHGVRDLTLEAADKICRVLHLELRPYEPGPGESTEDATAPAAVPLETEPKAPRAKGRKGKQEDSLPWPFVFYDLLHLRRFPFSAALLAAALAAALASSFRRAACATSGHRAMPV